MGKAPSAGVQAIGFSLFAGDSLWSALARLGLGRPERPNLRRAIPFLMVALWGALAVAVLVQRALGFTTGGRSFFADWAAMGQFFIGVPVLLAAEVHLDWRIKSVHRYFVTSDIIPPESQPALTDAARRITTLQRSWVDRLAWPLGIALTFLWLQDELGRHAESWYVYDAGGRSLLTPAGWTAAIVSIGFLNALWFRWAWKASLWIAYLWRLSRLRLTPRPDHPDLMGGFGLVSWVQMGFALAGFGMATIMAVTVAYNISVKHMSEADLGVWLPFFAFLVCAPAFFITPLLFFTAPLLRAKQRGLTAIGSLGTRYVDFFEEKTKAAGMDRDSFAELAREIGGLVALNNAYQHVERMRIVPFDLKSLGQFLLGSGSPFLPLLVKYVPFASWVSRFWGGGDAGH